MTLRQEISSAAKRLQTPTGFEATEMISNGWTVKVASVNIRPSGGACRSWKYLYYLIDPQGNQTGGYDRRDSFVGWAIKKVSQ